MAWLCGVNGLVVRGESSAIVIVHRTPPNQIVFAIRSDFERHPIGFRTLSANGCSSFAFRNITLYTT